MDHFGSWIQCRAMYHNCDNPALVEGAEVVLYFVCGRGPKGMVPGKLYLLNDAYIVPTGAKFSVNKREELQISGGNN